MITRREFIRQSASAMAAGLILPASLRAESFFAPSMGASDQINVALIGCRSMGWADISSVMRHEGVNLVALCDVDRRVLDEKRAEAEKRWNQKPELYGDYRQVLDRKDIDAVVIGTPDHWHCLIMADACDAGKDVYVEKPVGNSIAECDAMVAAARRNNRVVQVGQQKHSALIWHDVMDRLHSGAIGKIARVNVWANYSYGAILTPQADAPVPDGVDFNMWLGPARERTFNPNRFHGSWRMFWDYGGGVMTDMGPHLLDMALWGTKQKGLPKSVIANGGSYAFPNNLTETFESLDVVFEYDDYCIHWQNTAIPTGPYGRNYGLEFKGTKGTLVGNHENWEIIPNGNAIEAEKGTVRNDDHYDHTGNFLDCVRTRNLFPSCTIENGALCAKTAHMGNIAARTKQRITFDDVKKTFNCKEATKLVTPTYRKPWTLPKR